MNDTLTATPFGAMDLHIPPLVFGTTSLGNLFRVVPEAEKAAIVEAWFETELLPVVIDSAGKYGAGLSLEVIGRELDRLEIAAERVVISNKLGWRRVPLRGDAPTFEAGAWFGLEHDAVQDISYEGILRCWHEGNKLLRGRSANLVSVHDPDEYLAAAKDSKDRDRRLGDLVDAYKALQELKSAGEVVGVGVGAKDWTSIQELDKYCDFDWVMFANSFTVMQHPRELETFMSELADKQVAIINSALFHGGFLLGGEYFDYRRLKPEAAADRLRLDWRGKFQTICEKHKVAPFDVGVAFGAAHPAVNAIALSSGRAERVATHVAALKKSVPSELWAELKDAGLIRPDLPMLS